jgi:hypothetical protein
MPRSLPSLPSVLTHAVTVLGVSGRPEAAVAAEATTAAVHSAAETTMKDPQNLILDIA